MSQTSGGVILAVHVAPRASRSEIRGLHGEAVKVSLRAPPVDGKANAALIGFLAERLDVPLRSVRLVSGETGRRKRIFVEGLTPAGVASRLSLEP